MKQNLLTKVLLLFALIVGSSNVWADYEPVYTLDCPKKGSNSAYATYYDVTVNGIEWNAPGNQNIDGCWRIGGKASSSSNPLDVDRFITGKTAINQEVSKITFNHNGKSRAAVTVPYVTLTVASDEEYVNVIDVVTVENPDITKGEENSFDFTPTSPLTKWDNCYFKITIHVKNTDTSNGGLDVTSIVFYKTVADKTNTTTAITSTGITNTDLKYGTAAGSLSASVTAGGNPVDGATVDWESGDETVATITSEGVVTLVGVGTTTITATYDGNDTYYGSSDTYELTVTDTREATITTIITSGLTNTDVYTSTTAGQLTASVTAGGSAIANAVVTWESSNPTVATIDNEGNVTLVKAGSTTITVTYAGGGAYAASSDTYVLNVTDSNAPLLYESVSLYTSGSDSSTKITSENASTYLDATDKWNYDNFSNAYPGKNGCFKLGASNKTGTIETNAISLSGSAKLTFQAMQYKAGENSLTVTVTGATATGDLSVTAGSDFAEYTVYLNNATGSVVINFTSPGARIYLDEIKLVKVDKVFATISSAEYATFSESYPTDFSSTGITVFTATENETSVTLNEVTSGKVPANTPVVLYKAGSDGTVINVPVTVAAPSLGTNDLHISDGETAVGEGVYVLAKKTNGVGFYPWTSNNSLSAGKIYLKSESNAPFLGFNGEGTTGIQNIERTVIDNQYYTLDGRRVAQPTKGLYIINGQKVVVK